MKQYATQEEQDIAQWVAWLTDAANDLRDARSAYMVAAYQTRRAATDPTGVTLCVTTARNMNRSLVRLLRLRMRLLERQYDLEVEAACL